MLSLNSQPVETSLELMWETHREDVKRMLISLTRDIDLTDDILQDTYLRACNGFGGFRGGDAKAWLIAIAKNAFYAHARHKYFGSEVALDSETPAGNELLGSSNHIVHITLQQAIADLPQALRQALLMKHYGGFTYSEIAQRLGCPQGTAQQRVFTAIQKLRKALSAMREEFAEITCGKVSGKKLVDYVYGKLSQADMAAVKEHLDKCPKCRGEVNETVEVLRALDADEPSWKISMIMEPKALYLTFKDRSKGRGRYCELDLNPDPCVISYAAMQGEEVSIKELPSEDGSHLRKYAAHLPRDVEPGEMVELLMVCTLPPEDPLTSLPYEGGIVSPKDAVYVIALRLPDGARLTRTDPDPTEMRENGHVTVYYRGYLPANQEFKWIVEYEEPSRDHA